MGNKPPKAPPKTAKELKREMNRSINKMLREFNRDKFRLKTDINKMKRDLEKMVKNKEPKSSQRILAQNLIRNEAFITKYDILEAKIKGVKVQLAQVATTEAMVNIMKNMGQLLGKATDQINMGNIQNVIEDFTMNMEKNENMNEMMSDAFEADEEEIDDIEVDKYIDRIEDKIGGGGQGGGQKQKVQDKDTDFDALIGDLKK